VRAPRPRTAVVAGAVLAALAGLSLGARAWTARHVRAVTGRPPDGGTPSCLDCHRGAGPARFTREVARPKPVALAADPRGRLLYAATGAYRRVAVVDAEAAALLRWIEVPGEASGVAVAPGGALVAVSLGDSRSVAFVDPAADRVVATAAVGLEPKGLAFNGDGTLLFVANSAADTVSVVDVAARAELAQVPAGRDPYRVARSPDGRYVAVVARMAGLHHPDDPPSSEVTLLDARTGAVLRRVALPSCHLAEGAAFTSDSSRVLVPTLRVRNLLPITQVARGWVMSSALASVDAATGDVALLPLQTVNRAFPDPAGIAVVPGGPAFLASSGAAQVGVVDLTAALAREAECRPAADERFALAREWMRGRTPVAAMPGDVELVGSGARARVAVAERLGDSIALLSAGDGALLGRVALGPPTEEDAPRRGLGVFNSAEHAFQGAFSCRSCHPDGHTDGLVYDFEIDGIGREVVLNRSLQGVKGTAPFKWSGLNPTLARQCGVRFATVLTRADPIPGERLDDLVAYLESLPPPLPPGGSDPARGAPTTAVERGRAIFFRATTRKGVPIRSEDRCVTCHPPPHYTNLKSADVATGTPRDRDTAFDVPHLTGIARKAPFLHDGRALSLEEIWTLPGVEDTHGKVTDLNKADLNDLVEFLRSL
jgi:YVTN family beta-propeller protein